MEPGEYDQGESHPKQASESNLIKKHSFWTSSARHDE